MAFTKERGQALGRVRGKCRWCAASVQAIGPDWAAEGWSGGDAYECAAAPPWPCRPCEGRGFIEVRDRRTGETARETCGNCHGEGFVPGPHWPWRHPEPTR